MTKIAFTVETDPLSVGLLLKNNPPGIKIIPPTMELDGKRGDISITFIENLTINSTVIVDLAIISANSVAFYLAGRLHGASKRKMHIGGRVLSTDDTVSVQKEIEKLHKTNNQQG